MRMKQYALIVSVLFISLVWVHATAQTITETRHNLSVSGPGSIKATEEPEICLFCHTPHNARPERPLWNRNDPGQSYTLYQSSTIQATTGQPDGASLLCLSCHDGTIAPGNISNRVSAIPFAGGMTTMPAGPGNLSKDLSDDHPVSFVYDPTLSAIDGQLHDPSLLSGVVRLENGKMQCTSCHDPHKNPFSDFLVASNEASGLCLNCHQPAYWEESGHRNSAKTWNGIAPNPWENSSYTSVAQNGCANCHQPHSARGRKWLLNNQRDENVCFNCHNGNVASTDIKSQFSKSSRHRITDYTGIHDAAESILVTNRHVTCVDCHNPHASGNSPASAPLASGSIAGAKGIDQNGIPVNPVRYEYELCYRCHSAENNSTAPVTARVITQSNLRMAFSPLNSSFHPVAAARNNTEITGNLIAPNTASTVLYCSTCHSSDGSGAPAGPHGSAYPQILIRQYLKTDGNSRINGTTESAGAYALCYNCHNRTNIINNINTFPFHRMHIIDERTPCNTCHDPHGINGSNGNQSNLINFRSGVVTPSGGIINFTDLGLRHGSCQLTCHGKNHDPFTY